MTSIHAETLAEGEGAGPVIALAEPLSFWGGFDAKSGRIIDRRHSDCGRVLTGAILVMPAARGSSSGSSVLAEAIRAGTAPAGIVVAERDAILPVGALVARALYGARCPVVLVARAELASLARASTARIAAAATAATIDLDRN